MGKNKRKAKAYGSSILRRKMRKFIIGISGASGVVYGVELLKFLSMERDIETHLIITPLGQKMIEMEVGTGAGNVKKYATFSYQIDELTAPLASGSFLTDGMVVAPCSIKTLSAIATSYADNLLLRAADVTLKQRKPLILVVRETPLNLNHIKLMLDVSQAGGIILPPAPAFYGHPKTINELIDQIVGKICDLLEIENNLYKRWTG